MTHKKNAFMLLIAGFVIFACNSQLQASQMTDGQNFIIKQVLGGGIIPADESGDITPIGTLGQSVAVIGKSDQTNPDIVQYAGFWYSIKEMDDPIVSFMMTDRDITVNSESDEDTIEAILGLNLAAAKNITVTVKVTTTPNEDCDFTDFTVTNGTVSNANLITAVFEQNDIDNDQISISIINDELIEGTETIQLQIINVEGDAYIGSLDTLSINIPANDSFPITGAVSYMGSQTGELVVIATNNITGEKIDDFSVDWTTQTTKVDYSLNVAPGNYTILAFIDSVSGTNDAKDTWEACGVYTNVAHDVGEAISFEIKDADKRYHDPYIEDEETDEYASWKSNYPTLGGPGADDDQDGYSNFQEYLNGTDPSVQNNPYEYDGYDSKTDNRTHTLTKPYQIISTYPLKPQAQLNVGDKDSYFLVDVNYTTSDYNKQFSVNKNNAGTTGLGLVVHFNNTHFELADVFNELTNNLQNESKNLTLVEEQPDDDNNIRDFEDTTSILKISWLNTNSSWPSVYTSMVEEDLPIRLCTLKFKVKSESQGLTYGDTSIIRFSAQTNDLRYEFYASPTVVEYNPFNFDVDGNGVVDALTDGIQVIRYMFDLIDEEDMSQAEDIGPNATRTTSLEIYDYIATGDNGSCLDVDRDDIVNAQSDGLMILRYMFNLKEILTENALAEDNNKTAADIIPYIEQYMPRQGSDKLTP